MDTNQARQSVISPKETARAGSNTINDYMKRYEKLEEDAMNNAMPKLDTSKFDLE